MSAEKIAASWKKKQFKPVYWFEGEEDYVIDQLVHAAEHTLLSEAEAGFNLSVFYGKDASWSDVVNACMRYPMFSEKQVVILKEAQQMKELDKLENYIANPLSSTIFVVAHKEKKVDGRSKLAKLLKDKAEVLTTAKMKDNQLPGWTQQYMESKGYQPSYKAVHLLTEHIGNDLSRIANEVDKLVLNLQGRTTITEEDIETYVGISKEYNVFELVNAVGKKQLARAIQIVQYFESNPKAAPIQLILPSLYGHFSKALMVSGIQGDDNLAAQQMGMKSSFFIKEFRTTISLYGQEGIHAALLLLHEYNLRSVGIRNAGYDDASLLKEMLYKMMM
ncbi:MAG TPA: DNA polymerase III subunit delta [Lacibacter sp.]|nr:DNA polymerase III subunit delta [Lacibacter sp.]HMO89786.1 DNA polymerase III subunit delta [Lacibacter sp.]HMP86776.1 DNA polymerase III subunit delta [Lacibacter sp.]